MATRRGATRRPDLQEHLSGVPGGSTLLSQIASLRSTLDAVDLDHAEDLTALVTRQLLRLESHLTAALAASDPILLHGSIVPSLTSALEQATSVASTYLATQPSQLGPHVAQLADLVRQVLATAGSAGDRAAALEVESRARSAVASVDARLVAFEGESASELAKLRETRNDFDDLVTSASARLESAEAQARGAIAGLQSEVRNEVDADRETYARYLTEAHDSGEQLLSRLREVLSIAGDESLSANYGRQADREDKRSSDLRLAAVVFGVLTVGAAIASIALQNAAQNERSTADIWALWPGKLAMIATLAALAGYLGRESGRHRTYAQELRAKQLQLHNLGPYLNELAAGERAGVRKDLVGRFFGVDQNTHQDDSPTTAASVDSILEVIRLLVQRS